MKQYIIPHNYKDNGRIFGMFQKKHFCQALVFALPAGLGLLALPLLPLKAKVFALILLVAPPTIVLLMGYLDLVTHYLDHRARAGVFRRADQPEPEEPEGEEKKRGPRKKPRSFGYRQLVPLRSIRKGVVIREDGQYVRCLSVLPINFKLKSELERQAIILSFEDFLKSLGISFQVCVLTQKADIGDYLTKLRESVDRQQNQALRQLAGSYAEMITGLEESGTVSRRFLLSYTYPLAYGQKPEEVSPEAVRRYFADTDERIRQYLQACGNELAVADDPDFQLAQLYNTALCRNNHDLDQLEEPELWGVADNYADRITPRTIDSTNPGYLQVDGRFVASFVLAWIPYKVEAAWLEDLISFGEGVNVSIHYRACNPAKTLKELNMAIGQTAVKRKHAGENQIDVDVMENALDHARYIRSQMSENRTLFFTTVIVSVCADSAEDLERRMKDVESKILSKGMIPRRSDFLQSRAYTASLPLCLGDKYLDEIGERNMLSDGAAASYPFASFEFSDPGGVVLGTNEHNHSMISADFFNTKRHMNGNALILGVTGSGKTMTMQCLAARLRMQDIPVTAIVPLKGHEYRKLCDAMGEDAQFIKLSPSSQNIVNIMEIRAVPGAGRDSLMLAKVSKLHAFFSLAFGEGREGGMTLVERQYLDDKIIALYEGFGITPDNKWTVRKRRKMPTLGDLFQALDADENTKRLAVMLRPYVSGSLRCFNGQTNVQLHAGYVVFDVSELTGDAQSLGMQVVADLCEDMAAMDPAQKKAIFIDEVWRLVGSAGNRGNRRSAEMVQMFYKAIRGLGGIVISSMQDVVDAFAINGGEFGKSLVNNSNFKIVMHNEEQGVREIKGILNLSEEEQARITNFPRGRGLFYAGNSHVAIHFRPSEAEYRLISTDRADLERMRAEEEAG